MNRLLKLGGRVALAGLVSVACARAGASDPIGNPALGKAPGHAGRGTPLVATGNNKLAIFSQGCFWGVEERFRRVKGVVATAVGYAGGHTENPSYEDVCSDQTGHAESVLVEFDPVQVPYSELLRFFFATHDPTSGNAQGPDHGTQYRSAIFVTSPEQERVATEVRASVDASGEWRSPLVTQIVAAGPFTRAEEYHQKYLVKNPGGYSCHYMRPPGNKA